jgi:hypothetical protein
VDPRASLDALEKRKSCPSRESNFYFPAAEPVASRYTDVAQERLSDLFHRYSLKGVTDLIIYIGTGRKV